MRAGDVAAPGTIPISPENGRQIRNMIAVVKLVRPVRPPAAIPAELSTNVVALLVPKRAPILVAKLSATRALSRRLLNPDPSSAFSSSASNIWLFLPVPMNVPIESNVSERLIEKIVTITNGIFAGSEKRDPKPGLPKKLNATSLNPCTVSFPEKIVSGRTVTPIGIPMIVVATIPIRIAPLTFITIRMMMIRSPITDSTRCGALNGCIPGVTLG